MLTKAYIKSLPTEGDNYFKVRIPLYEDNTGQEAIFDALLCKDPSNYNGYSVGETVYVQFEDERMNIAVIMGKLYNGVDTENTSYNLVNELKVTEHASLPPSTKLGDYTAQDLVNLYNSANNGGTEITEIIGEDANEFTIKKEDTVPWFKVEAASGTYYVYTMTSNEDLIPEERKTQGAYELVPDLESLTGDETPTWDIRVDPEDPAVPYKTQIKYRAWCTTFNTYYGWMELMSMNPFQDDMVLEVKGLNLEK